MKIRRNFIWKMAAKIMPLVMTVTMLAGGIPSIPARAEEGNPSGMIAASSDEYSVDHEVTEEWQGGYKAEITIANLTDEDMVGWELAFSCADDIIEAWPGVLTDTGSGYLICGPSYDPGIPAGESVTVEYTANGSAGTISVEGFRYEPEAGQQEDPGENGEEPSGPSGQIYEGDGYTVEAVTGNQWEGGYNLSLTIRNTSSSVLHNWGIVFTTSDSIRDLYNADVLQSSDDTYLLRNRYYNQDIPAGGSVTFGYTADYTGTADIPEEYGVSSIETVVESEDFTVSYLVSDVWESGAVAQILIENTSEEAIEDWILEMDADISIAEIWNAQIVSHEGSHYVIRNVSYAQNIMAGETAVVGMRLSAVPSEGDTFSNMTIRQILPSEGGSASDNNVSGNDVSDNNVSGNGVSDNNVSGNETPEEYINHLDTGDAGEIYYKVTYSSDIVDDPDGIPCVKNQFLLSASDSMSFSEVEAYLAGVGARIVGYIEVTNDYQVEMLEDTDVNAIQNLTDRIGMEPWVRYVGFNYLWLEEPDFYTSDPWSEPSNTYSVTSAGLLVDSQPYGPNWGLEAINYVDALVNAGVISCDTARVTDIHPEHLSTVKMGIYDSAFDRWHEDLSENFVGTCNNFEYYDCNNSNFISCFCDGHIDLKDLFIQRAQNGDLSLAHGTLVAGIMCAGFNNNIGITGICVKNELYGYAIDGLEESMIIGSDKEIWKSIFEEGCGFSYLIGNNVKVINYSRGFMGNRVFATSMTEGEEKARLIEKIEVQSNYIEKILNRLLEKGYDFLIITSAGNENDKIYYKCDITEENLIGYISHADAEKVSNNELHIDWNSGNDEVGKIDARYNSTLNFIDVTSPCYDHIICVGSVSNNNSHIAISSFSNGGSRVDIYAPGENIYTTYLTGCGSWKGRNDDCNYVFADGTSAAAPFVSGVAGLAYNVNPYLSAVELKEIIINTAQTVSGNSVSNNDGTFKMLDAAAVIASVAQYEPEEYTVSLHVADGNGVDMAGAKVEVREETYSTTWLLSYHHNMAASDHVVVIEGITDADGTMRMNLPTGRYYIIADNGEGGLYYPFTVTKEDMRNHTCYEAVLEPYDTQEILNPFIQFKIRLGDRPLFGITVHIRSGWNEHLGDYVTDANGNSIFSNDVTGHAFVQPMLPAGAYTLEICRDGQETLYSNITVVEEGERYVFWLE